MARRRPLGITILGSLAVVLGLVLLVFGLVNLLTALGFLPIEVDPGVPADLFLISALLNVILGVLLLATGNGLLNLSAWAWWTAFLVALVSIVRSLFAFLTGVAQAAVPALLSAFIGLALLLFFTGYLLTVRGRFQ